MTRPGNDRVRIPTGVWVLGGVSLLMDTASELIHGLLPGFLVVALGASALSLGLIEGVAESTALIVKVFSGTLSDYLGRRKALTVLGYGLAAASKPLFALATGVGMVFTARFIDRIGKGVRGAPRDALVADITPPAVRGAAYGLRQSLDTVGAFLGPLLAIALMLLWADDFRKVFWVAVIPAALAVALLATGIREPQRDDGNKRHANPIHMRDLAGLGARYWWVVVVGAIFTLARFSEAFLILRAQRSGLPLAWLPVTLVVMNVVYAGAAYPFGRLSDNVGRIKLLAMGLLVLIVSDLILGAAGSPAMVLVGVAIWGLHMGITQGLLSAMVADTAPDNLRGTAFGFYNLLSGLAMLAASVTAGLLWELLGPSFTFYAGAAFCVLALAAMALWRPRRAANR